MSEENKPVPGTEELTAEDLEQIAGGCNGTHIPKLISTINEPVPKPVIEGVFKF